MYHSGKKATTLEEVDQAVQFNEPISPDHDFFTNFSDLRGGFEERLIYKNLNVSTKGGTFTFNSAINANNKSLLFLGGMRGTGKTSELAKYAKNLDHSNCFFIITCNIDKELDMNDVEYMDILIFQLEKLTARLKEKNIKVDKGIIGKMEKWFQERTREIVKSLDMETGIEVGVNMDKTGLLSNLLGIFGNWKVGVKGSRELSNSIRTTLKNRFPAFAKVFNQYLQEVNFSIREKNIGKEVCFIIDGLEKTMSTETRRKIIIEESNRLQQIDAYTIFTLPIELMKERQLLNQFSNVEAFPFVKLLNRDNSTIVPAWERYLSFIQKRIAADLFEDKEVILKVIYYSGGSPRELLRILELAAFFSDEEQNKITHIAMDKALQRLANQTAQYLTEPMLEKLQQIKVCNESNAPLPAFDEVMQEMLEKILIMEYNDGNYKRANPILELSNIYQQRVGQVKYIEGRI
ncbi:MAG: hypothetical protein AAFP82_01610 [Bacteroidota bacterium]